MSGNLTPVKPRKRLPLPEQPTVLRKQPARERLPLKGSFPQTPLLPQPPWLLSHHLRFLLRPALSSPPSTPETTSARAMVFAVGDMHVSKSHYRPRVKQSPLASTPGLESYSLIGNSSRLKRLIFPSAEWLLLFPYEVSARPSIRRTSTLFCHCTFPATIRKAIPSWQRSFEKFISSMILRLIC